MDTNDVVPGLAVYHRADPGKLGVLTGNKLEAMFTMAEVDWGNQLQFTDVTQLVARQQNRRGTADEDVRDGRYGTIDDLRRRITFEKLRGLLTDVFYSMKTSEIDFYPHQFKPVLRFIESATSRLLIADEVGLGKTIEAGLIWTEWQARKHARRLLIVCPPTLVPKWVRELQDRFNLPAEATNARHLEEMLERFDRRGPGLDFVLVTSYHALRPFTAERDALRKLAEGKILTADIDSPRVRLLDRIRTQGDEASLNDSARFLDMVVFDEAHSMKNTGAASYLAGEILSMAAGAAVCLTATPVHNTSRDLYALLRLIDPEVFRDEHVFDLLRQQNLPVIQLQNALADHAFAPADIQARIAELPAGDARDRLQQTLANYDGSAAQRTELRFQTERLNLLGNFINRTRKRDVIANRVIRVPVTIDVMLSDKEATFYRAVLALVRQEVRRRGNQLTSFHLIHPALKMSSSMPVMAATVHAGRWGGFEELAQLAEDLGADLDDDTEADFPAHHELVDLARHDFAAHDTKYAALRQALHLITHKGQLRSNTNEIIEVSPRDKVIIFAFFKDTIAYLERRLAADGFQAVAVTGDIKDRVERDRLLRRFGEDGNQILLCSEIGAEGVDLQFARVVINYDLPWNPMRVEQRIGRIDRIGQKASSIVIVNFHVQGTIDGSIFTHLYRKINVFEQSIGALEGILGEAISRLTAQIFEENLTLEQIAMRAEQTADAVMARATLANELESNTGALFAFQDLLAEQVGESQRLGRFIKPQELQLHMEDFLAARYRGHDACLVVADSPCPASCEVRFSHRALAEFENFCQEKELAWPAGFSRSNRIAKMTFDPAVHQEARLKSSSLHLVTHLHPFFRWITRANEQSNNQWHKVSAVRLESQTLPSARYFYLIYRMSLEGLTRRDAFHYILKELGSGSVLSGIEAEAIVNEALDKGESLFPRALHDLSATLTELRQVIAADIATEQRRFREDQALKFDIRRQQLTAHFDRRIEAQRRRIETALSRARQETAGLAGFRKYLQNLEQERRAQLAKLELRARNLTESISEVACGVIEITQITPPRSEN